MESTTKDKQLKKKKRDCIVFGMIGAGVAVAGFIVCTNVDNKKIANIGGGALIGAGVGGVANSAVQYSNDEVKVFNKV